MTQTTQVQVPPPFSYGMSSSMASLGEEEPLRVEEGQHPLSPGKPGSPTPLPTHTAPQGCPGGTAAASLCRWGLLPTSTGPICLSPSHLGFYQDAATHGQACLSATRLRDKKKELAPCSLSNPPPIFLGSKQRKDADTQICPPGGCWEVRVPGCGAPGGSRGARGDPDCQW